MSTFRHWNLVVHRQYKLGDVVNRQQEIAILKLWRQWCIIWPRHYGHELLDVAADGYDPVFDVIPAQMYIDFYTDVTRRHSGLRDLDVFEVVDTALNQTRAPESLIADDVLVVDVADAMQSSDESLPLPVVTVELEQIDNPAHQKVPQNYRPQQPRGRQRAKKSDKLGVKKSA